MSIVVTIYKFKLLYMYIYIYKDTYMNLYDNV